MTEPEHTSGTTSLSDQEITTADLAGRNESASSQGHAGTQEPTGDASLRSRPEERTEPLFPAQDATELRARWDAIQAGFVDEPRTAVEQADSLVAAAMKRLAETFASERSALEAQWDRGDDVSTEDLRVALRRYRSFFGRLLAM